MNNLSNDVILRLARVIERDVEARDRVDISLKEYEDMKYYIDKLTKENKDLKNKVANLEDILRRCQLPVDLIREGKIKEVVRFEDYEPITADHSYMIKLTVAREDMR